MTRTISKLTDERCTTIVSIATVENSTRPSWVKLSDLQKVFQRALNTWQDIPPEIQELADKVARLK